MVKVKKKYEEGASKTYITRSRAIKKLQISIADFRRLCIFKGIYPREPSNRKKANRGKNTPNIFYYTKDIQYLLHEPLLNKFRDDKIFARKLSRALVRNEVEDAKRLDANRPRYKLDTLVKERYPTFVDALRDLDDPLSMLFLFAIMPATDDVSFKVTQTANRLCHEWMAYVAREKVLKKVFVSIKGVYYQAIIKGQEVLWLVPFDFPQNVPTDIDFKVMLTFLEFYTTLVQFILYRLYTEAGLVYPPKVDEKKMKGVGGLSAFLLQSRQQEGAKNLKSLTSVGEVPESDSEDSEMNSESEDEDDTVENDNKKPTLSSTEIAKIAKEDAAADDEMTKARGAVKTSDQVLDEEDQEDVDSVKLDDFKSVSSGATPGDILAQPSADSSSNGVGSLFSGLTFLVGREVPSKIAEFLILSCGGKVILESALDEAIANEEVSTDDKQSKKTGKLADLSKVTHQISDRPKISSKVPGRVYVQPQWIFDSINKAILLPVSEYAIGEKLPPHLSPWGDRAGYNPEAEVSDIEDDSEEEEEEEDQNDEEEEEEEEEEEKEARQAIAKEKSGVSYSESKKTETSNGKKKAKATNNGKKRSKEEVEEEELQNIKVSMMSNKQKKIYKDLKGDQDKQEQRAEKLKQKKRKIEKKNKK